MIHRIRDRAGFERLRNSGRRHAVGSLWCIAAIGDTGGEAQVAFALGRSFGTAVARNRMRRRIRALLDLPEYRLAPGWYLFGAHPEASTTSFEELSAMLHQLVERLSGSVAR